MSGTKNNGTFTQWNTIQQGEREREKEREREGTPTLHGSMDGTGEHYSK